MSDSKKLVLGSQPYFPFVISSASASSKTVNWIL